MIRHKASGEFMPELKRTRGYSHWNPGANKSPDAKKFTGAPRLIPSRRNAIRMIAQWNANPNARYAGYINSYGEDDYGVDTKPDGRTKDDLEVVAVDIVEVNES